MKKQIVSLLAALFILGPLSGCSLSIGPSSSPSKSGSASALGSSAKDESASEPSSPSTSFSEPPLSSASVSSEPAESFTITFNNWDGTELQKSDWDYGSVPSYTGETPKREKTAQYSYAWMGWNPAIAKVTAAATYRAVFEFTVNEYVVTFVSNGGTAVPSETKAYGSKVDQPVAPTKEGSSFQGWYQDEELTILWDFDSDLVVGDVSLFAKWKVNTYTVTFNNWDGSELQKSDWDYGATPVYNGTTPTKAEGAGYAYTFSGWTPEIVPVSRAVVYTATFAEKKTLNFTLATDGQSYSVSGYGIEDSEIIIPSKHNELPVTRIDYFYSCDKLISIAIPDSVTSIDEQAFDSCTSLASVTIGNSLASIGDYAFHNCIRLASISVDPGNPNYQSIDGVLYSKDGKTLITYPAGKSGSAYAIPDFVTTLGTSAFSGCSSLASVTIPDSVTSIGKSAFSGCESLASISVGPDNPNYQSVDGLLLSKDAMTLILCPRGKVSSNYQIPSCIKYIGDWALASCNGLTSITIPSSVWSIGDYAFYGCKGLTSVKNVCPNSIGDFAFGDCTSLASITIAGCVKAIGKGAFSRCTSLASINVAYENETFNSLNGVLYSHNYRTILEYPGGRTTAKYEIPDSVWSIGPYAFYGCTSLTSITIPFHVTSIEASAFQDCVGLTSIALPNSVTSIGDQAFTGCKNLASISVGPDNPNYQFVDGLLLSKDARTLVLCLGSKVASIYTIPDSVRSIGRYAFSGCTGLISIVIPDSVTSIQDDAFSDCGGLTLYCEATSHPYWTIPWDTGGTGKVYWYSETSKVDCWHYVNGVPTLW